MHEKSTAGDKRVPPGVEAWQITHVGYHPTHNSVAASDDGSGTGLKIDLYRESHTKSGWLLQQSRDFIFLANE